MAEADSLQIAAEQNKSCWVFVSVEKTAWKKVFKRKKQNKKSKTNQKNPECGIRFSKNRVRLKTSLCPWSKDHNGEHIEKQSEQICL